MSNRILAASRPLALVLVITAGLYSMIATSPPPPPWIEIFAASPESVCSGGNVTLTWEVFGADKVTLTATPLSATEPILEERVVAVETGTLEITVSESVTITLQAENEIGPFLASLDVTVLPSGGSCP